MATKDYLVHKAVPLIVCALLWHRVSATALGEVRKSEFEKDAANTINGQSFNQEQHKGEKISENQNALSENKNTHFAGAKDSGRFVNQDVNKKIYDDNKFYGGQNFNQDYGERAHGIAQKKGHKKGHHNSGFRNSYHKDESSNNSSYFDDYSDEADQSNIQSGKGKYGNEMEKRYDTRKEDGLQHIQDNARQGSYDRVGGTDARNVDHRDYDRKNYVDDRRDGSQVHRGQSYGGRDREYSRAEAAPQYPPFYDRPIDYPRPHGDYRRPFAPIPPPPPPYHDDLRRHDRRRQTITIYDDPRDVGYPRRDVLRDNNQYVHLDVRPGNQRFQRYDSYYEPPRREWGVHRRSDINPLIYNRY